MTINAIPLTDSHLSLRDVRPGRFQHRRSFKPQPLLELAESIRTSGLINPPIVYPAGDHHELLVGERRWRAMCALAIAGGDLSLEQAVGIVSLHPPDPERWPMLAQYTIPVRICHRNDPTALQTLAVVENLQREDLTPLEEAAEFAALSELGHSDNEIARLTHKTWSYVRGMLNWLELSPQIRQLLEEGLLPKDHRVSAGLLSVSDEELRLKLARQFADRRSPIRVIKVACEKARRRPAEENGRATVPVAAATVRIAATAPPPPAPCFCPACSIKLQELAEELCSGCRSDGLTARCLKCDGVIEFINRLVRLNEAAYE